MRRFAFSVAFLLLFAPSAVHAAVQATGDCASIVSPPAGDYECTGDVTVSINWEWLELNDRNYTIHGNLTLEEGTVHLTRNLTVDGNLTITNESHFRIQGNAAATALTVIGNLSVALGSEILIQGKHELMVRGKGNGDGRLDVTTASWLEIECLSIVNLHADTMSMDRGTTIETGVDSSLRSLVGCGLGEGGGGYEGGGGASYGGAGSDGTDGKASTVLYGSVEHPDLPGSCGGSCAGRDGRGTDLNCGGLGGPAIKLQVTGELKVNGSIGADGSNGSCNYYACSYPCPCEYYGGAGSGGSIWIEAATLSGTGSIHATGGKGGGCVAGSGGGGRVAIYAPPGFAGTITAPGGGDTTCGRAGDGTVYFDPPWPSRLDGGIDGEGRPPVEPSASDAAVAVDVLGGEPGGLDLAQSSDGAGSPGDLQAVEPASVDGAVPADAPAILADQDAELAPDLLSSNSDARPQVDVPSSWPTADGGTADAGSRDAVMSPSLPGAKSGGCGCALGGNTDRHRPLWPAGLLVLALGQRIRRRRRGARQQRVIPTMASSPGSGRFSRTTS